ncbi:MAG: hypothetical protein RH917_15690 [Lacipirellulaceae bacterium]
MFTHSIRGDLIVLMRLRISLNRAIASTAGLLLGLLFATDAPAAISSFSGDLVVIDPPTAVTLSSLEDDFLAKLFLEKQSVLLEEELLLDVSTPGVVSSAGDLSPATLIDVEVNSYLLHADPVRHGFPARDYAGSITFEEEILGLMVTGAKLDASDSALGSEVTRYIPPSYYRGFEGPGFRTQGLQINDSVGLAQDLRTITFHFMTTSQLDQLRIITRASSEDTTPNDVPEPSSSVLLVAGLFLFKSICSSPIRHSQNETLVDTH